MAIETWLPAVLGYLMPVGLFLRAWGGMEPHRARRAATLGALALGLAALGYFATGFAFHLGGARTVAPEMEGLEGLAALWGPSLDWGVVGLNGFFLAGKAGTPQTLSLYVIYLPLVAAAVLLVTMSLSGRARGWQVTCAGLVTASVVFPLAACWVWGRGWLAQLWHSLSAGHGFVDYAGSGVVYFLGGMAALGALVGLGERLPRESRGPHKEPEEMPPAHFPLLANLGALLFGLGWLGWSLSVPFHVAGARIDWPHVAVCGLLGGAGAILASQFYCWLTVAHADPLMAARGAAAGFVAVSAGAPFIPPWGALLIGALAGFCVPLCVYLVERKLRLPDETASVSLGLVAGLAGLLAVPLLADGQSGQGWNGQGVNEYLTVAGQGVTGYLPAAGFRGGGNGQLLAQLTGAAALIALAFTVSWVTFLVLQAPYRPRRVRVAASPDEAKPAPPAPAEASPTQKPRPARRAREKRAPAAQPALDASAEDAAVDVPPSAPAPAPADTAAPDHGRELAELWKDR